jgi:hypothetical protein
LDLSTDAAITMKRDPCLRVMVYARLSLRAESSTRPGEYANLDRKVKYGIARIPFLGRTLITIYRAKIALSYLCVPLPHFFRWLFTSKEISNFTYHLEPHNKRYLASTIGDILDVEVSAIEQYINEIEENDQLRRHIAQVTAKSDEAFMADKEVGFGRRIGWYAFARALKPGVVVETGVDKGLGACILTAALKKNAAEGYSGRYYGTDINPKAGYLLCGEYAEFGTILYGDSIESLRAFQGTIDLFVNDSDHSPDYEYREYCTVANKLSKRSIVLGDNCHWTDGLWKFSMEMGRHFLFFQEKPSKHWYQGDGIGISFNRLASTVAIPASRVTQI